MQKRKEPLSVLDILKSKPIYDANYIYKITRAIKKKLDLLAERK